MTTRKLTQRQFTRIGCRRMGDFNTESYRQGVKQRGDLSINLGFVFGGILLLLSGGVSLPFSAILMFPRTVEHFTNKKTQEVR